MISLRARPGHGSLSVLLESGDVHDRARKQYRTPCCVVLLKENNQRKAGDGGVAEGRGIDTGDSFHKCLFETE